MSTPQTTQGEAETVELPAPRTTSGFPLEQAIAQRRSVRSFNQQPLSLEAVSQLLWAAQGLSSEEGYRTAPSAGALYPLELYLLIGQVSGLAPGLYHYLPYSHQLQRRVKGELRPELAKAALHQTWLAQSAAVLVFTALPSRTTGKYGQRGLRYIHIELGHSAQNVLLQAQALKLAAAVVGAFDDEKLATTLQLPKYHEPLYLLPVGHH